MTVHDLLHDLLIEEFKRTRYCLPEDPSVDRRVEVISTFLRPVGYLVSPIPSDVTYPSYLLP